MDLFKTNGQLKARGKLLAELNDEYLATIEYIDVVVGHDEEGNDIVESQPTTEIVVKTEADLDAYLATRKDYRDFLRKYMVVTVSSGKTFDADLQSRLNISDAILLASELSQTETVWRLADNSNAIVTVDELKEARLLALQKFATISGIV